MPFCRLPFDSQKGAHLDVLLAKPEGTTFRPEEIHESKRQISMLIDTGASKTAISPTLANDMGLLPMGKTTLRSATQEVQANLYLVDLICDVFDPPLIIRDMSIIEFPFADGWRGFLGRDFLENLTFEMNGMDKHFKIVF
jgi:predicted aspartyl protease